jgi:hypothetical protein
VPVRDRRGDEPRVDEAAAEVGALNRCQRDPRIAKHLADSRVELAQWSRGGGPR